MIESIGSCATSVSMSSWVDDRGRELGREAADELGRASARLRAWTVSPRSFHSAR